jgi:RIO kinase 1
MIMDDGLARLVEEGIIHTVHSRLMSGKEATVYVVERDGVFAAAKVYKARDERTFKKTSSYVEGRNQTRNSRDRRAMQSRTSYGRGLIEEGWQDTEFKALRKAFDAGVRVPEPYNLYENILLMELLLDGQGSPALRLADFRFSPEEAHRVHLEVFLQVKALLATGLIHGDLSAYNVLMAAAGPTLIDMPQVVDVAGNNNARQILRRDLRNVTEHLARFDARLLRFADCGDALFLHLMHGTLDTVTGPEIGAQRSASGGHRSRDAERGRAGRDKGRRPQGPAQGNPQGHVPDRGPRSAPPAGPRHPGGVAVQPGVNRNAPVPGGRPVAPARETSGGGDRSRRRRSRW